MQPACSAAPCLTSALMDAPQVVTPAGTAGAGTGAKETAVERRKLGRSSGSQMVLQSQGKHP
jgi:hypothetical protein